MIKGMDKFELGALIVATIGVVGGSVALYVLLLMSDSRMNLYIYVLSNPSFDGWLKVGKTRTVHKT